MQTSATTFEEVKPEQDKDPARTILNVLILYEDLVAGLCAKRTFDWLAHELGNGYEFDLHLWQFELLKDRNCERVAGREGIDADMVVVSAHGNSELAFPVKSWLEKWLVRRRKTSGALIGIFDHGNESFDCRKVIHSYLQDAASRGKMNFFTQVVRLPSEEQDYAYTHE